MEYEFNAKVVLDYLPTGQIFRRDGQTEEEFALALETFHAEWKWDAVQGAWVPA